jgi:hypothetical protein
MNLRPSQDGILLKMRHNARSETPHKTATNKQDGTDHEKNSQQVSSTFFSREKFG